MPRSFRSAPRCSRHCFPRSGEPTSSVTLDDPSSPARTLLLVSTLAILLLACSRDPCTWEGRQNRDSGSVQATSLACDGVSTNPAVIRVRYEATSAPLRIAIDATSFVVYLSFEPKLPDGTYQVEFMTGDTPRDPNQVTASGAQVMGTFTFRRSRDVPFVDIAEPEVGDYTSTIDVSFDLVAVFSHPDPAMGPGCRLETGPQQVALTVSGPVSECSVGPPGAH